MRRRGWRVTRRAHARSRAFPPPFGNPRPHPGEMVAMPRPRILVLVPMLVALAVGVSAVPAGATSWGTAPRVSASNALPPELVAVRVGRHQGFDRVVLELRGSPPGYNVRYVPQVVQDGSGRPVPLAGSA